MTALRCPRLPGRVLAVVLTLVVVVNSNGDDVAVDAGSSLTADPLGETSLHRGDRPEMSIRPDDVDARNYYGVTPLAAACRRGDVAMVDKLIAAGAKPNWTIPGGATPLMLAARTGNADVLDRLIEAGAELNSGDRNSQTALMWAAAEGHVGVVGRLIDAGADLQQRLKSGFDPLAFAARQGRTGVVRMLIQAGCDPGAVMKPSRTGGRRPRSRMTPLLLAVENAHYETAMVLVDAGADPNHQDSGYAPLHTLAWVRRPENGDGAEGDPAPIGSGELRSLEFVRRIVAAGADVNLRLTRGKRPRGRINHRGATPMLMACQTVDLPLMRLLLELGGDPTISNDDGCTTLMAAAGIGNHFVGEHPGTPAEVETAIRWLVDKGLDVNAVDQTGETAMHGAAYRCFPETVDLLVSLGADPAIWNHENEYGWTPLKIARGYRAGSFKPDPPTIAAIRRAMDASP